MSRSFLKAHERETIEKLRLEHKKIRSQMEDSEGKALSGVICERLLKEEWYEAAEVIFGYYPLGKEVDCRPFLNRALRDGKRVALPRTGAGFQMDFYEITSLEYLEEGSFHVSEPPGHCPLLEREDGVAIVPGVVFDKKGSRYGYGKGYYDRYFARFPNLERMGLAYEHQMEEALETAETDIKMHRIYTEEGCYHGKRYL